MIGYMEKSNVTSARRHASQKLSRIDLRSVPLVTMRRSEFGKIACAMSTNASGVGCRSGSPPRRRIRSIVEKWVASCPRSRPKVSGSENAGLASGLKCPQRWQLRLQCSTRWYSTYRSVGRSCEAVGKFSASSELNIIKLKDWQYRLSSRMRWSASDLRVPAETGNSQRSRPYLGTIERLSGRKC